MLSNMSYPDLPVALGVIRAVKGDSYDQKVTQQIAEVKQKAKIKNVDDLLNSGNTWVVK